MKNIFNNVLECIGNTPLIRINRLNPNPRVAVYVKLEAKNPGGSIKDRTALSLIEEAERDGTLTPDKIILEATSGNTGIGLAMVAAVKGYRLLLAMPETASMERQKILKALGAEILLTPGALGTDGAIEEVYNLVRENPDRYFMPDQFNNPANPAAHYHGTGPEIYEQTDGKVNTVVVTLGTAGTAMGILQAMKERNPAIEVVGVEPYPGHKVQGLKNMKESYVPGIFDRHSLDRVVNVKDADAFEMARRLAREEGIFAGMSSGAAMAAAAQIASERSDGIVVTILPDGGDRYLSTNLFTTLLEPDFCFYNLAERRKTEFKPLREGKVRVFVTGPTLDEPLTLQEARRFVLADLLSRFLKVKGFAVTQIVPIPDVDSRTIQGALSESMDLPAYTQRQVELFLADLDRLAIQRAYRYPKTSEHLDAVSEFVRTLIDKGAAYEKLRSVYFDLCRATDYGSLSHIDVKNIHVGKTVDLDAYEKLNPRDFTLLKRATLAELKRGLCMKTDWGNVLPTLHIAGAAIALHDLGCPVDIVVSGMDFLFPHLENMRQIGEAVTGKPFANEWMICERIWAAREERESTEGGTLEAEGKAEGIDPGTPVRDLLAREVSPQEIRYWLLNTHYRKPIQATEENIRNSGLGYRRLREFISRLHFVPEGNEDHPLLAEYIFTLEQDFFDALADDLNAPNALAALFKFVRQLNPILDRGECSGLQKRQIFEILQRVNLVLGLFDWELQPMDNHDTDLLHRREEARKAKRWDEADRLRDELRQRGIQVRDTGVESRWEQTGD